jgi:alanine dehydrogenase
LLIVSEQIARQMLGPDEARQAVIHALMALHRNEAEAFPIVLAKGVRPEDSFSLKAASNRASGATGLKVGSYWPGNRGNGIAAHGSTVLLLDPETGQPHALVGATHLTALRTAAIDAAAVDALARAEAHRLLVIGAGKQALHEVEAILKVRAIDQVMVWNRDVAQAQQLAKTISEKHDIATNVTDLADAVCQADIIVTITAALQALFPAEWVRPGTHISAMGADAHGKQELDPALARQARCFADVPGQAVRFGELQHGHAAGLIAEADIIALGAVLCGEALGRHNAEEITLFDSSGIALQDLAVAQIALDRANAAGQALHVDWG